MTKSYVSELTQVYLSILADALYAYPALESELSKDRSRLISLIESRGLPFLMVDLPAVGKHLDRCLSEGEYKFSGLPGSRRTSKTVVIPKLFRGLYLLIFDGDGRLKEDVDVQALFFLRQLLYGAKRASYQCSDEAIEREVAQFLEADGCLPHPEDFWSSDFVEGAEVPDLGFADDLRYASKMCALPEGERTFIDAKGRQCNSQSLLMILDKVVGIISTTLGPYRPDDWDFRHGPGAVSDLRPGENRYLFDSWSSRLESVYPLADCAFHNYASWAASARDDDGDGDEPFSKLVAVPKSYAKPRLIAAEPHQHMWCQQNAKHFMYTRCEQTWLDRFVKFTDQTQNQELCIKGSEDGSLVTIDLSAASDRVSCNCVSRTFRRNRSLLLALRSSRTRRMRVSRPNGGVEFVQLRKYSTMGNATTFPVESLIFLAITITAELAWRGVKPTVRSIKKLSGKVSVFGDDIIAPKESAFLLTRLLEVLDFKVNSSKSFLTGRFRESCGVDSFAGQNITPAYWKGPCTGTPESIASALETTNNFYKRFLVNTSQTIRATIKGRRGQQFRFPMTDMLSGVAGERSFCRPDRAPPTHKVRWNYHLQRDETYVPVFQARSEKFPICDDSALLQYFTDNPEPHTMWVSGVAGRPELVIRHRWIAVSDLKGHEGSTP